MDGLSAEIVPNDVVPDPIVRGQRRTLDETVAEILGMQQNHRDTIPC